MELQLIRASEFIRVNTEGELDLSITKSALAKIARACRKRGFARAMLDLRKFQPGPKPVLTTKDLTELVDTFFEIGFSKQQRLAVLYTSDPHHRARLFSFLCRMHGWQVKGFGNFENAMMWLLSQEPELSQKPLGEEIPIRIRPVSHQIKPKIMKSTLLAITLVWAAIVPTLTAQTAAPPAADPVAAPAPPPAAPAKKSAADLEKLVEPIALHPDPLIAIILPASAYPLEIVQAARFVKDTNNIPKVEQQTWDENVKAVAKFPEVVAMMDKDLPWTMDLGEAFIDQSEDVMNAIQSLRVKAQKAGNLKTSPQQIVTVTNIVVQQTNITEVVNVTKEVVQVVPSNPSVIYVPTYPPAVYYPAPVAYAAPLLTFGMGMAAGAIIANNCNWGHGSVDVDVDRNVNKNVNRNTDRNSNRSQNSNRASGGSQKWQPNQSRVQQSGARASAGSQNARGYGSGGAGNASSRASSGGAGARPSAGTSQARSSAGGASAGTSQARSSGGGAAARPSASQSSSRGSSPSASSRSSSGGSAFSGGSSSSARSSSTRGSSSRSGGGGGGGGRGGGGGGRGGGGGGGRR